MFRFLRTIFRDRLIGAGSRSGQWPKVRTYFLKENPTCAVCGGNKTLEVHHIKPFHTNPDLELDLNNLITLCENKKNGVNCHLLFGHLGNYRCQNPNVVEDSYEWNKKILTR